ncbi:hypothetical protein DFH94DRAFT_776144 [Russula ochroleuca]|uniref:Uncharacterized protein n=1 Tax=Russula ochroleuca TaxID=152965 RepID=A0A9P5JWS1_9AGAM|nr:hypothetical protein DFH94DRAFT_776144 [Russula ochroleuca]
MTTHNYSLAPPTDPSIIRCKTCRAPLPDATWKNCDSCRRNRTENYRRWKKSAELRSLKGMTATSQVGWMNLNPSTSSSQGPGRMVPPDHHRDHPNEPNYRGNPIGSSPPGNNQPRTTPASTVQPSVPVIEYQRSDELIDALSVLPPCSNFIGKFSVVADPAVNNSRRAHMFANQLHDRAIPISENSRTTSLNAGSSNSYALVFSCICQEACQGRFIVAVDDDTSHPYGVPGQRIGALSMHPSLPD